MASIPTFVYDEKNQFSPMLFEELTKRGLALSVVSREDLFPAIAANSPDLVLFNLSATPGVDHLSLIQEIRSIDEHLPIFVLTENSDVATAVSFMRAGSTDFMMLPAAMEELEISLKRASQMYHLARKVFQVERKSVG